MTSAYEDLVARLKRIHGLQRAASHLHWDQQTYMPPGGTEARAGELAALSTVAHERFTDPLTGRLLDQAEDEADAPEQRALLREVRWSYERETRVPSELVDRISQATTRGHERWVHAKAKAEFQGFVPVLEELVDLKRAYAQAIDPDRDPYEVLFEDYEPGIPLERALAVVRDLRDGLGPLIQAAPEPAGKAWEGTWSKPVQAELHEHVLDELGYDREHGRLDEAPHPFSTGNPYDARITTRYNEQDPADGLLSTVHEFGHALYTLGLPKKHLGTPLGAARDLVVHESQSRLWENHVARTLPFWERLLPTVQELFGEQAASLTPRRAWQAVNTVQPSLIRVEADELTYHMHIAVRLEVERALIQGELEVASASKAWDERMEATLGITPPDAAQGILQDVHWSQGAFGYFPTYSLGSALAAQLFSTYEAEQGTMDAAIRDGRFGDLRAWLQEKVHRHGKRYETPDLIERATGQALSAEPFLAYAESKFHRLCEQG